MATACMTDPVEVLALASTCKDLWALLEKEVYITDVLDVKTRSNGLFNNRSDSQAQFPSESDIERLEQLQEDHPRGGLHVLARNGPSSSMRKAIAAARRFWPGYLNLLDTFGDAPIHLAARHGQLEIVKLLLSLPDEEGIGECAARAASENGCWGPRPLHEMINHFTVPVKRNKNKAPAKAVSTSPQLPQRRNQTIIRLNSPRRGDFYGLLDSHDMFSTDALGFAILAGHVDVAEFLLAQPCCSDEFEHATAKGWNDDGGLAIMSPLHLAALAGMPSVVAMLLAKGQDPNGRERYFHRCSPLHMAATRDGTRDAVKVLLNHGANLSQLDDEGRTVVQWAEAFGVEGLPGWLRSLDAPRTESLRSSFISR